MLGNRASNHARWAWPGEPRNGVEDQLCELAAFMRGLGEQYITFAEDGSFRTQANCDIVMGRYTAMTPYFKKLYWDHGMGGGPLALASPPKRIAPEMARDYLLVRYASLLPGVLNNDIVEGYISEAARPWTVQSLMAGTIPKTHSEFIDDPATFRGLGDVEDPPATEREPSHRLRGHEEFLKLLRLCCDEPLLRNAPLSIEGVSIEGDAAVVGLLRPTTDRALLTLIQFANRRASVTVRLAEPVDVPAAQRSSAGQPQKHEWKTREILRSMVDEEPAPRGEISGARVMQIELAACGFRVFELTR